VNKKAEEKVQSVLRMAAQNNPGMNFANKSDMG
jgi:hypothetical protein